MLEKPEPLPGSQLTASSTTVDWQRLPGEELRGFVQPNDDQTIPTSAAHLLPLTAATPPSGAAQSQPEQARHLRYRPFSPEEHRQIHSVGTPHDSHRQQVPSPPSASVVPSMLSTASIRTHSQMPLEDTDTLIEVRSRQENPQAPSIFFISNHRESVEVSLRRVVQRSRQSEFSLSVGFAHRDEVFSGLPEDAPPPGTSQGTPPPGIGRGEISAAPARPAPSAVSPARPPLRPPAQPTPSAVSPAGPPPRPPAQPSQTETPTPSFLPLPLPGGDMRTGTIFFAQTFRARDRTGRWRAQSQLNLGTELAASPEMMGADAQFISWTGRLERTQILNSNHQLTALLETQLSPSNLLPPHQFKTHMRGYEQFDRSARPEEINGNNGIRFQLSDRIALLHRSASDTGHRPQRRNAEDNAIVALIPFLDLSYSWGQGNPLRATQQFLGRTGVGLSLRPFSELGIDVNYFLNWGDLLEDEDTQNIYVLLGYETTW